MIEAGREHAQTLSGVEPGLLVFLDETSFNTGMTRPYGWGARRERLVEFTGDERACKAALLSAAALGGPIEPLIFSGALNGEIFAEYLSKKLLAGVCDGAKIVMDNLSSHKVEAVADAVEEEGRGIEILYLPPYSPDLNPVELVWSKLKHIVKGLKPASYDGIVEAVGYGLDRISSSDMRGWFSHCGYVCSNI